MSPEERIDKMTEEGKWKEVFLILWGEFKKIKEVQDGLGKKMEEMEKTPRENILHMEMERQKLREETKKVMEEEKLENERGWKEKQRWLEKNRIEKERQFKIRKNVIVKGWETVKNNEEAQKFFKDELGVEVEVIKTWNVGDRGKVGVEFKNMKDKLTIIKEKSRLKEMDKVVYIENDSTYEERRIKQKL